MLKYPIEIELTDFCGLKCQSCINPLLENKGFISLETFKLILEYIDGNKNNILYVNFSGIGDIFLHKNILIFLELFIEKFRNTEINILIPTKGQSINKKHIKVFKKIQNSGINLNISIGFFSIIKEKHDILSGVKNFDNIIKFIKKLKENKINFSLELLDNDLLEKEKKYFNIFLQKIQVGGSIHNYHNFSGEINNKKYSYGYEQCSFDGAEYKIKDFYCSFIPLISKSGNFYTCSIAGKNKQFLVGKMKELFIKFPNYIDLVFYIKNKVLDVEKCNQCSIYSSYKRNNA